MSIIEEMFVRVLRCTSLFVLILYYGETTGTDIRTRKFPSIVMSAVDSVASQIIDMGQPRRDLVLSLELSFTVVVRSVLPVALSISVTT